MPRIMGRCKLGEKIMQFCEVKSSLCDRLVWSGFSWLLLVFLFVVPSRSRLGSRLGFLISGVSLCRSQLGNKPDDKDFR